MDFKTISAAVDALQMIGFRIRSAHGSMVILSRGKHSIRTVSVEDARQTIAVDIGQQELDWDVEGIITFNGMTFDQWEELS